MPKPPILKVREVIAILERLGFVEVRHKGSHKRFKHADGRHTTVPVHTGDVSPIILKVIAREIGLTVEDLLKPR